MTVGEIKAFLATLLDDAEVFVPEPFDPDGPETWESPVLKFVGQQLFIGSASFVCNVIKEANE